MDGKMVAITGCTTGTGFEMAKQCAALGATVFMLNRASSRADEAFSAVDAAAPGLAKVVACDLQSFQSVKGAADQVHQLVGEHGLDVLCNNAGIMAFPNEMTSDGYDVQMQTNHLSHFLLTAELLPALHKASILRGEARGAISRHLLPHAVWMPVVHSLA
jgi:NAD(P)-dependent dehydrogenase (short-subunit alcohol dehydrogenase family)